MFTLQTQTQGMTHTMTDKNTTSPSHQLLVDFGPLLVFFGGYKFYDIKIALAAFMVAITIAMIWAKIKVGHISGMQKLTFVIVMISGTLTFATANKTFLYMKPTAVYALFAAILGVGMLRGKLFLRDMMAKAIEADIPENVWRRITKQAIGFFVLMMAANETIWRTMSEEAWVNLKVFGFTGATFVFLIVMIAQMMKYMPSEDEEGAK